MKNIKLILSYDGTGLLGWQKTPLGPTVEEHLETALFQILQENVSLQAASRTDAGVHAEGQVVNFLTQKPISPDKLHKSLNALLPKQIVIQKISIEESDFHPTLASQGKEYHYYICNAPFQKPKYRFYSWHVPLPLDLDKMQQALSFFRGTHDFSTFCNQLSLFDRSPICTLNSLILETFSFEGKTNRLCLKVQGNRFLFRMMRNLAGTLVYVGLGKIPLEVIPHLLQSRKRTEAGVTAPAHGLHLIQVLYKNIETR